MLRQHRHDYDSKIGAKVLTNDLVDSTWGNPNHFANGIHPSNWTVYTLDEGQSGTTHNMATCYVGFVTTWRILSSL